MTTNATPRRTNPAADAHSAVVPHAPPTECAGGWVGSVPGGVTEQSAGPSTLTELVAVRPAESVTQRWTVCPPGPANRYATKVLPGVG